MFLKALYRREWEVLFYDMPEAMCHDRFRRLLMPLREDEVLEVLWCTTKKVGKVVKKRA